MGEADIEDQPSQFGCGSSAVYSILFSLSSFYNKADQAKYVTLPQFATPPQTKSSSEDERRSGDSSLIPVVEPCVSRAPSRWRICRPEVPSNMQGISSVAAEAPGSEVVILFDGLGVAQEKVGEAEASGSSPHPREKSIHVAAGPTQRSLVTGPATSADAPKTTKSPPGTEGEEKSGVEVQSVAGGWVACGECTLDLPCFPHGPATDESLLASAYQAGHANDVEELSPRSLKEQEGTDPCTIASPGMQTPQNTSPVVIVSDDSTAETLDLRPHHHSDMSALDCVHVTEARADKATAPADVFAVAVALSAGSGHSSSVSASSVYALLREQQACLDAIQAPGETKQEPQRVFRKSARRTTADEPSPYSTSAPSRVSEKGRTGEILKKASVPTRGRSFSGASVWGTLRAESRPRKIPRKTANLRVRKSARREALVKHQSARDANAERLHMSQSAPEVCGSASQLHLPDGSLGPQASPGDRLGGTESTPVAVRAAADEAVVRRTNCRARGRRPAARDAGSEVHSGGSQSQRGEANGTVCITIATEPEDEELCQAAEAHLGKRRRLRSSRRSALRENGDAGILQPSSVAGHTGDLERGSGDHQTPKKQQNERSSSSGPLRDVVGRQLLLASSGPSPPEADHSGSTKHGGSRGSSRAKASPPACLTKVSPSESKDCSAAEDGVIAVYPGTRPGNLLLATAAPSETTESDGSEATTAHALAHRRPRRQHVHNKRSKASGSPDQLCSSSSSSSFLHLPPRPCHLSSTNVQGTGPKKGAGEIILGNLGAAAEGPHATEDRRRSDTLPSTYPGPMYPQCKDMSGPGTAGCMKPSLADHCCFGDLLFTYNLRHGFSVPRETQQDAHPMSVFGVGEFRTGVWGKGGGAACSGGGGGGAGGTKKVKAGDTSQHRQKELQQQMSVVRWLLSLTSHRRRPTGARSDHGVEGSPHNESTSLARQDGQSEGEHGEPLVKADTKDPALNKCSSTSSPSVASASFYQSVSSKQEEERQGVYSASVKKLPAGSFAPFGLRECQYVGLENLGATCYMNVYLQTLFMNVHFRDFLLSLPTLGELERLEASSQGLAQPFQAGKIGGGGTHGVPGTKGKVEESPLLCTQADVAEPGRVICAMQNEENRGTLEAVADVVCQGTGCVQRHPNEDEKGAGGDVSNSVCTSLREKSEGGRQAGLTEDGIYLRSKGAQGPSLLGLFLPPPVATSNSKVQDEESEAVSASEVASAADRETEQENPARGRSCPARQSSETKVRDRICQLACHGDTRASEESTEKCHHIEGCDALVRGAPSDLESKLQVETGGLRAAGMAQQSDGCSDDVLKLEDAPVGGDGEHLLRRSYTGRCLEGSRSVPSSERSLQSEDSQLPRSGGCGVSSGASSVVKNPEALSARSAVGLQAPGSFDCQSCASSPPFSLTAVEDQEARRGPRKAATDALPAAQVPTETHAWGGETGTVVGAKPLVVPCTEEAVRDTRKPGISPAYEEDTADGTDQIDALQQGHVAAPASTPDSPLRNKFPGGHCSLGHDGFLMGTADTELESRAKESAHRGSARSRWCDWRRKLGGRSVCRFLSSQRYTLVSSLQRIFAELQEGVQAAVRPDRVADLLADDLSFQEDANELQHRLFEILESELGGRESPLNFLGTLFGGRLRQTVQCKHCAYSGDKEEYFFQLNCCHKSQHNKPEISERQRSDSSRSKAPQCSTETKDQLASSLTVPAASERHGLPGTPKTEHGGADRRRSSQRRRATGGNQMVREPGIQAKKASGRCSGSLCSSTARAGAAESLGRHEGRSCHPERQQGGSGSLKRRDSCLGGSPDTRQCSVRSPATLPTDHSRSKTFQSARNVNGLTLLNTCENESWRSLASADAGRVVGGGDGKSSTCNGGEGGGKVGDRKRVWRLEEDMAQQYQRTEHLRGDSKYLCPQCGEKREAKKRTQLSLLPPYLQVSFPSMCLCVCVVLSFVSARESPPPSSFRPSSRASSQEIVYGQATVIFLLRLGATASRRTCGVLAGVSPSMLAGTDDVAGVRGCNLLSACTRMSVRMRAPVGACLAREAQRLPCSRG